MRIKEWLRIVGSRQFGLSSEYDCHVYALRSSEGVLLIDTGSGLGQEQILANLREEFGDLSRGTILVTHKHPDHACGAAGLAKALGWPVTTSIYTRSILEQGDNFASSLRDAQAQGGYPRTLNFTPCPVARSFEDGTTFTAEGFAITAIRVRGHADDAMAFLLEHDGMRCLFSADVVFYGGVLGVINAFDSSLQGYRQDLRKLAGLGIDALLPGHGLFTLRDGQRHIDTALGELERGFMPRMIGQGDLLF